MGGLEDQEDNETIQAGVLQGLNGRKHEGF